MKTLRLLAVGDSRLTKGCEHFRDYFQSHGSKIDLEIIPELANLNDLPELARSSSANAVRCSLDASHAWLGRLPMLSLGVSRAGAADCFVRGDAGWSAQLLIESALHDSLVREGHHLDLRAAAYVLGRGPCLRIIAATAAGLGYRRVWLVGEDEKDVTRQREELRRVFVGTDFSVLAVDQLTLQTIDASLMINSLDLGSRPELAADLAYFNFMRPGGIVADLDERLSESMVLAEATKAGLRTIASNHINGRAQWLLAQRCGLNGIGTEADFLRSWEEFSVRNSTGSPQAL